MGAVGRDVAAIAVHAPTQWGSEDDREELFLNPSRPRTNTPARVLPSLWGRLEHGLVCTNKRRSQTQRVWLRISACRFRGRRRGPTGGGTHGADIGAHRHRECSVRGGTSLLGELVFPAGGPSEGVVGRCFARRVERLRPNLLPVCRISRCANAVRLFIASTLSSARWGSSAIPSWGQSWGASCPLSSADDAAGHVIILRHSPS